MEQSRVAPKQQGSRTALKIATVACLVAAVGAGTLLWQACIALRSNSSKDEPETLYRVQSRSMEPNYIGPRAVWSCRGCARHFTTSVDLTNAHELASSQSQDDHAHLLRLFERVRVATCPYCGENASSQDAHVELGELIDGEPLSCDSKLDRWDAVICREPSGRLTLKRVIGLPNERVSLLNGDVFVNGERAVRDFATILATASRLDTIEPRVSWQRLDFVNVVYPGATQRRGEGVPVAISNESTTPCANGDNVAQVEFVRDFILTFDWLAQDQETIKLAILARRPDAAYLIDYDQPRRRLTISAVALYNGQTLKAKRFERLERADFQTSDATTLYDAALAEPVASRPTLSFALALVDGQLILHVDHVELARVELPDARSSVALGITEPFAILGAPERVSAATLYRDLHYSAWTPESNAPNQDDAGAQMTHTPLGQEIQLPNDRVFTLGDNSPASLDCRFLPEFSISRAAIVARVEERQGVAATPEREEASSER